MKSSSKSVLVLTLGTDRLLSLFDLVNGMEEIRQAWSCNDVVLGSTTLRVVVV